MCKVGLSQGQDLRKVTVEISSPNRNLRTSMTSALQQLQFKTHHHFLVESHDISYAVGWLEWMEAISWVRSDHGGSRGSDSTQGSNGN